MEGEVPPSSRFMLNLEGRVQRDFKHFEANTVLRVVFLPERFAAWHKKSVAADVTRAAGNGKATFCLFR